MKTEIASFTISYSGNISDENLIDFYDVSQALMGFQRTLALTTHLILNDEIITQAPSLRGAYIYALPPEPGSWLTRVMIVGTALWAIGTSPNNTPLGHLIYSGYDYIISETLGFHVDYEKSLGQQYEELHKNDIEIPTLEQHRFDALAEKCFKPIKDMHRPIFANKTALFGNIHGYDGAKKIGIGSQLSIVTFEYMAETKKSDEHSIIKGRVSSYNSNTYKGRIYIEEEKRPISFTLSLSCRNINDTSLIAQSLLGNTRREEYNNSGYIYCKVFKYKSKTGKLKFIEIVGVSDNNIWIYEDL